MLEVPGYRFLVKIHESVNTLVYRAVSVSDERPVVLKILNCEYPEPEKLARFKHEYKIIRRLDLEGVIRPYGLENYKNTLLIVFEDFGGDSLKKLMRSRAFPLTEVLTIGIEVIGILGNIQAEKVIHNSINPSNIIFNPDTGQLKIIDFASASDFFFENLSLRNCSVREGALPYISPEQTGRMNRTPDYRSDYYSFGVSLYEMLTGRLPFDSCDAMELVYCHIAKYPPLPHQVKPEVPRVVSDIVMKLLAKTVEERYQSSRGIMTDLKECMRQIQARGKAKRFSLGHQDISDKLLLLPRLYGRDQELETLLMAFERCRQGKAELMLVSGYSGVGKSSLVRKISRPVAQKGGYFISGKFDQFQQNIPYSAIVSAFSDLVRELLTGSESQLAQWQEKLLEGLGPNGDVIIEVIPEVALIVGKQPQVPLLPSSEAQNRFDLVVKNFIKVFARPEHPLVIFLDDLQWIDAASLKMLSLLITAPDVKSLLFIGASRDNEVVVGHPLQLALDELQKTPGAVHHMFLLPLKLAHITQFISDVLNCGPDRASPLAELVLTKTNGNPFFINEFMKSLYAEGLLSFDYQAMSWQWSVERIQSQGIGDDVVGLMKGKIRKLAEKTQQILCLAACLGNEFELKTLALVSERIFLSAGDYLARAEDCLLEATREGLVMPVADAGDGIYRFVHDRIQQTAYSLFNEQEQLTVHWTVGKVLQQNISSEEQEQRIFSIVNQLNRGIQLPSSEEDRPELAHLNLMAAKKAKSKTAFGPALQYLKVGLSLLEENSWESQYDLTLALHLEAMEAASFTGNYEYMEQSAQVVLLRATTLLDKIPVYEIKIQACIARHQLLEAIELGLSVLNLLGLKLSAKVSRYDILFGLAETRFALIGKGIEDLKHLPRMTDKYQLAVIRIITKITSAAYLANPRLMVLLTFKSIILSIKYGNASGSCIGYAVYGLTLGWTFGNIEEGYRFGRLALSLLDTLDSKEHKAKIYFMFNYFMRHWKEHFNEILNPLLEGYQSGVETGDLEYAAYAVAAWSTHAFFTGKELDEVERATAQYSDFMIQHNQETALHQNQCLRQMVLNLKGLPDTPWRIIGEAYNEEKMLASYFKANDSLGIFLIYSSKLILSYLFYQYEEAFENAAKARLYLHDTVAMIDAPVHRFYDSLALLAFHPSAKKNEQRRIKKSVAANQKKMKKWAQHAPMNSLHKYYLVEAERYRIFSDEYKAMYYYDQAVALSRENGYINEEALANELAGKYYAEGGRINIARSYMLAARYCYLKWGAGAKIRDLDERYPELLAGVAGADKSGHGGGFFSVDRLGKNFDLATLMKASQAISGEIVLDRLLYKLLEIAIENAGAEKGVLLLARDGELMVEASVPASLPAIGPPPPVPVDHCDVLPATIVQYVVRTNNTVVLKDASNEGMFTNDRYVFKEKPRSILCIPILRHNELIGILYMENNHIPEAFTPNRVEVLGLLCSQAAISIENAKFYSQVKASEEKYRSLYENAVEGIFQATLAGGLINVNPAMARIIGYESGDALVSSITDIVAQCFVVPGDADKIRRILDNKRRIIRFETQFYRKDGRVIWVSITGRAVHDVSGRRHHYEGSLVDITDRKEKEEAQRERQAAEAVAQAKSDFLANVSHEIRTPLTLLLSPLESVLQGDYHGKIDDGFFQNIHRNAIRLLNLINNILDFSKIEAGQMIMKVQEVDMIKFVKDYCDSFRPVCETRDISLIYMPSATPVALTIDPDKFDKVLMNLLSNALKFTNRGGRIEIGLNENDSNYTITCRDTGVGIPADNKDSIFERFTQIDTGHVFSHAGSGIGLALVKEFIEMHGGTIEVQSKSIQEYPDDHGSVFTMSLPKEGHIIPEPGEVEFVPQSELGRSVSDWPFAEFYNSSAADQGDIRLDVPGRTIDEARYTGQDILIVEDSREMRDYLKLMLSKYYHVHLAENGAEGLRKAQALGPDLIVTDVMMPVMNGYEMTKRVKEDEQLNQIPVIVLTAKAEIVHKIEGLGFGADDYITKPFNSKELITRINNLLVMRMRTKELREAQARLAEQERILTEAHIAGGMAHEIRNTLGAAKLRMKKVFTSQIIDENIFKLNIILQTFKEIDGISKDRMLEAVRAIRVLHDNLKMLEMTINEVNNSTERGLQVTRRVMDYSRLHTEGGEEKVDLDKMLKDLIATYGDSMAASGIEIQLSLEKDLIVEGSNPHFYSVFQNLLLNARDAISEKNVAGGRIKISGALQDGEVVFNIEDDGVGITEENMSKIFNPFFSTKPSSGMGLGLSECEKILNQYCGRMDVESIEGKGSLFRVVLPRSSSPDKIN